MEKLLVVISMENKNLINTLSYRYFFANKVRNLSAIIAVLLTTILFTSFFEIVIGLYESSLQVDLRKGGYSAHAVINNINEEEFEQLSKQSQLKEIGYEAYIGDVNNSKLISRRTECWYMDDTAQKLRFALVTNGHQPMKKNEISADSETLRLLGVPLKEGVKVTLKIGSGNKKEKQDFVLSGWWKSDVIDSNGIVVVSEKYKNDISQKLKKDIEGKKNGQLKNGAALISFKNRYNLEKKLDHLFQENGYTRGKKAEDSMFSYINGAYHDLEVSKKLGTIGMSTIFSLLIVFTGYLLIRNIFQMSIDKDIRFFKLLQTIGFSQKQIKRIVKRQGIYICVIGNPLGLYIGYILGKAIIPRLFYDIFTTFKGTQISVEPNVWVFLFAIGFSFITVMLSFSKLHKLLDNHYNNTSSRFCLKRKNKKYGGGIIHMAFYNTTRNIKRTVITIVSLSLCFVIVNTVYTVLRGMNFETYVAGDLDSDFIVAHSDYFNLNYFMSLSEPSSKLIDMIKEQKGFIDGGKLYCDINSFYVEDKSMKESDLIYPANVNSDGAYMAYLYGLEEFPWSKLTVVDGKIDKEILKDGKHLLVGVETDEQGNVIPETKHFNVGDKIIIEKAGKADKKGNITYSKHEYIVMGHVAENYLTNTCRSSCNYNFYVPAKQYLKMADKAYLMSYKFNVKEENLRTMNQFLVNYRKKIAPDINHESVLTYREAFEETFHLIQIIGLGLAGIVGLIGLINFVMTMLYNIRSRRNELAMLESIGLLKSQQIKMFIWEGTFYTIFTIILSAILSILASMLVSKYFVHIINYYEYTFTLIPFLFIFPILELLAVFIALFCGNMNHSIGLVERLNIED